MIGSNMAWILVFITITAFGPEVKEIDLYQSITECFLAREALVIERGGIEYFPINEQAICINTDKI